MISPVDWRNAPKGAEAGYSGCYQLYAAWYRRDKSGEVEQICHGAGVHEWTSMGGRKDFPHGALIRPLK